MFDLKYYKIMKINNYKDPHIINMLITYEYITLNDHMCIDLKKKLFKEKTDKLNIIFKEQNLLIYPCSYDLHMKNKFKLMQIIKMDPDIYLIFNCNKINTYNYITHSASSHEIKETVLRKSLNCIL